MGGLCTKVNSRVVEKSVIRSVTNFNVPPMQIKSILLIDDDEDEFYFFRDTFFETGITVYNACDGPCSLKLLEQLEQDLPSLIVLDLCLKKMPGMELLAKLKSKYSIPILIHSISFSDETALKAKKLGALDCVKKGNSCEEIEKLIQRFLD
jgi:CheY-like chemotaxis protein